jgi:hypothetical protein
MTFEDLLVSGEELDRQLLVKALAPYVRIEKETLSIRPLTPWRSLTAKAKIVAYLLTRKGMRAHGMTDDETCSPADVINATGIPSGSVHPALKSMFESRPQLVERDSRSRYWVPNWAVQDAVTMLTKESGNDTDN